MLKQRIRDIRDFLRAADNPLRWVAIALTAGIVAWLLTRGMSGLRSIGIGVLVAVVVGTVVRVSAYVRDALKDEPPPGPEAETTPDAESAPDAEPAPGDGSAVRAGERPKGLRRLATREVARLEALLALLVLVVHAAITGYVDIWTIVAALTIATVTTLLSDNVRIAVLIGALAAVFATTTVLAASLFRGNLEARALVVSLAAVVVPVLVSDRAAGLLRIDRQRVTLGHQAILAVLTLTLAFLGWTRADWLPGVVHGCYTLPTSSGITVLRATGDGDRCYGLIDTADAGVFARASFSQDPVTTALQRAILKNNEPVEDGDLTVVWMGALSCDPAPDDPARCGDGRDYPAERDQLRALLLAQHEIADRTRGERRLHVVIADATQDVRHADDIAHLIADRRPAMGERVVVIGGGDSRDSTQAAITTLLGAGIPFIAPNLLADLGAPGRPFVDRPGYLQLAPSNLQYADDAVKRIVHEYGTRFRLDVYQEPAPTDQYTTSLVNDLLQVVDRFPQASTRRVASLARIDESICDTPGAGPPTVLFFADRWTRFANFVSRVDDVCGHAEPRMVVADVSVSRFMADYRLRVVSTADWPVDYYVGGPACVELRSETVTALTRQMRRERTVLHLPADGSFDCADRTSARPGQLLHACALDAAAKFTSTPCRPNDLGTYLVPAWDAVMLADALLPRHRGDGRTYLERLRLPRIELATGADAEVVDGRLRESTIRVRLWHVDAVNDPARIWELPRDELRLPSDPPLGPE